LPNGPIFTKFPVLFPVRRESRFGDRFAADCLISHAVRSPWCYFPVGENRRHSRGLDWHAPVSIRQFLPFRSVRGGFWAANFVANLRGLPVSCSKRFVAETVARAISAATLASTSYASRTNFKASTSPSGSLIERTLAVWSARSRRKRRTDRRTCLRRNLSSRISRDSI